MPPEVLGPQGLLVAAVVVIGVLWRDHLRADRDDRDQRDRALAGWEGQTAATRDLSASIEAKDRQDAARRRLADDS